MDRDNHCITEAYLKSKLQKLKNRKKKQAKNQETPDQALDKYMDLNGLTTPDQALDKYFELAGLNK